MIISLLEHIMYANSRIHMFLQMWMISPQNIYENLDGHKMGI